MKITYFDTLDSTNKYLKENFSNLNNLDSVVAYHQTSGRGRLGRTWVDQDDLLMSILIKEGLENIYIERLSLLICHTIFRTIKEILRNNDVKIKWPNDILVDGKKICGILLEGVSSEKLDAVIIGFGVNVNSEKFSDDLIIKATSLKLISKIKYDINELSKIIFNNFLEDYDKFLMGDNNYLRTCKDNSYLIGKIVSITENDKTYLAKVVDILENGHILLDINGSVYEKSSGEISLTDNYK